MPEREPEKRGDERLGERRLESERGEHRRKSIWIIDDGKAAVEAILRAFKLRKDVGVDFTHYQEGEQALADFKKFAEMKGDLPDSIFMDYDLARDVPKPKYRRGTEVIAELKIICEERKLPLPEIIAFSTDKAYTEELIKAGAVASMDKMRLAEIMDYVDRLSARD